MFVAMLLSFVLFFFLDVLICALNLQVLSPRLPAISFAVQFPLLVFSLIANYMKIQEAYLLQILPHCPIRLTHPPTKQKASHSL